MSQTREDWKPFMEAFSKSPSDDLLDGRSEEISQTLAGASRSAGGLIPEVRLKHEKSIAELRDRLMKLPSNPREKFAEMDSLLRDSKTLASRIDKDSKDKKNLFPGQKGFAVFEVERLIKKGEEISHPLLRAEVDKHLVEVKRQYELAQQQKTARGVFKIIEQIDTSGLDVETKKVQQVDQMLRYGADNLRKVEDALNSVPDQNRDGEYNQAVNDLTKAKQTHQSLLQQDPTQKDFKTTVQNFYMSTNGLFNGMKKYTDQRTEAEIKRDDKVKALSETIDGVLKQAQKVLDNCDSPFLAGALKAVETKAGTLAQEKHDALAKGTPDERLTELENIKTAPLVVEMNGIQDRLQGVPRMIGGVEELLAGLKDENAKSALLKELATLKGEFADQLKGDKPNFGDIKKKLIAITKDVAKATKQDEYALLLQTQFGVSTERIGSKFQPNLKGTYEAMAMVPDSHVGQDKLQKVIFDYTQVMPYGEYSDSTVRMQGKVFDYTFLTRPAYMLKYRERPFVVDGKEVKSNHFNITMLHEIGHSVDDKNNVMGPLQAGGGYGKWEKLSASDITTKCSEQVTQELKLGGDPTKSGKIKDAIKAAVEKKGPGDKPAELSSDEWKTVKSFCERIAASKEDKEPWYKPNKAINIGSKVYHEAYGGDWVGYDLGERSGGSTVSSYQWRAPGEWFACLYSVAWMKNVRPKALGDKLGEWFPPK